MNKEDETIVMAVVEGCKVYSRGFILKRELIRKLEEAFPEEKAEEKKEE